MIATSSRRSPSGVRTPCNALSVPSVNAAARSPPPENASTIEFSRIRSARYAMSTRVPGVHGALVALLKLVAQPATVVAAMADARKRTNAIILPAAYALPADGKTGQVAALRIALPVMALAGVVAAIAISDAEADRRTGVVARIVVAPIVVAGVVILGIPSPVRIGVIVVGIH